MRNKFAHVRDRLREIAADRSFEEFMRSEAADCVTAAAQQEGTQTLETALDWVAALAGEDADEKVFRYLAGNLLLDFPRQRHRPLLERLAHMQRADGPFGRHFDESDIERAFAQGDDPPWNRFADPWRFYDPVAIAARQKRWAEEDAEMLLDDEPPQPVIRSSPKIGRNDPCPCGSGKKYKKCCLPAGEAQHTRAAGSWKGR
jgi:hypothetical protein